MAEHTDTSNIEAFQWGQLLPIVVDSVIASHPDLDFLDTYLEWLYGDTKGDAR